MVTNSHARAAAWAVAAILGVSAGFQVYWELGGTWGVDEASGGAVTPPLSASEQIGVVIIGLMLLAFAGLVLVRVGYWGEHVPSAVARLARIGAWVLVFLPLLTALAYFGAQTDSERLIGGPINLILALLAFVVARSELPVSPRSRAVPPSGKPGAPTPAR